MIKRLNMKTLSGQLLMEAGLFEEMVRGDGIPAAPVGAGPSPICCSESGMKQ